MRQIWAYMHEMMSGPGHFRFLMQPLIAILFGIRDGRRDSHHGRRPVFVDFVTRRGADRWRHVRSTLRPIIFALCLAIALSLLFQYWIRRDIHFVPALVAAFILVALPYLLARGFSSRIDIRWHRTHPRKASV